MAKWKCEICGNKFENFHAQVFDNKIYCPLCFLKKENRELKKQLKPDYYVKGLEGTLEEYQQEMNKVAIQQEEFIKYLEDEIILCKNRPAYTVTDIFGSYDLNKIELEFFEKVVKKYKEIIGDDR